MRFTDLPRRLLFAAGLGIGAAALITAFTLAVVNDTGNVDVRVTSDTQCASDQTTGGALVDYIGNNCNSLGSAGSGVFNSLLRRGIADRGRLQH